MRNIYTTIRKRGVSYIAFVFAVLSFLCVSFLGMVFVFGQYKWVVVSRIPSSIRAGGRIVVTAVANVPYLAYHFKSHNLPSYDIRVDPQDIDLLNDHLPDNPGAQLTDENKIFVPATFGANGKTYEVELRYRGVSRNHWLWEKKSMRVRFDSKDLFAGIEDLNLIVPSDRLYVVEEFNHYRARKLGLLVPQSTFVVVTTNGKNPTVYWATEHFDKRFLETKQLSSDTDLFGENDNYIAYRAVSALYDSVLHWKKYTVDPRFHEQNYTSLSILFDLLNTASDEEFKKHIFSILDKENFYAWSIHNVLAFGEHQDWEHNMKFYFDPSLGKLQMIPWDVSVGDMTLEASLDNVFEEHSNPLAHRILGFPEFMAERNERLWHYLEDEQIITEELAEYDRLFASMRTAGYVDNKKRVTNASVDAQVQESRTKIEHNLYTIRNFFTRVQPVASLSLVNRNPREITVVLNTKSLSPVEIERIELFAHDKRALPFVDVTGAVKKEILPRIVHRQLPSPEYLLPIVNDYYKAFQLEPRETKILLRLNTRVDRGMFRGAIHLKNKYTGETVVVPIDSYTLSS